MRRVLAAGEGDRSAAGRGIGEGDHAVASDQAGDGVADPGTGGEVRDGRDRGPVGRRGSIRDPGLAPSGARAVDAAARACSIRVEAERGAGDRARDALDVKLQVAVERGARPHLEDRGRAEVRGTGRARHVRVGGRPEGERGGRGPDGPRQARKQDGDDQQCRRDSMTRRGRPRFQASLPPAPGPPRRWSSRAAVGGY